MIDCKKFKEIKHCPAPFENIEIHVDGSVYTCCPFWNNTVIGNVYKDSVENIWNSENAIDLRTRILNGDYSLCNKKSCMKFSIEYFYNDNDTVFEPVMKEYPKIINLDYDYECNSACIICRDKVTTLPYKKLKELNSKIDSVYIPLLKNAKVIMMNSAGEVFASRHSRLLLKKIIQNIPDVKFEFITNGFFSSEKTFKELKITPDRIKHIAISLHAANKVTYGKMTKNGEKKFDTIIKNIEYISNLNKNGNFSIIINFVLSSLNYKDLPDFLTLVKKCNYANPLISEYRYTQNQRIDKRKDELTLTDKNHKEYNQLKKILKMPIVKENRNRLAPILQQIQDED